MVIIICRIHQKQKNYFVFWAGKIFLQGLQNYRRKVTEEPCFCSLREIKLFQIDYLLFLSQRNLHQLKLKNQCLGYGALTVCRNFRKENNIRMRSLIQLHSTQSLRTVLVQQASVPKEPTASMHSEY